MTRLVNILLHPHAFLRARIALRESRESFVKGEYLEALEQLQRGLRYCPNDRDLRLLETEVLYSMNAFGRAAAKADRLLNEFRDDPAILDWAANILDSVERYGDAAECREKALSLLAKNGRRAGPDVSYNIANALVYAYFNNGQREKAKRCAEIAREVFSDESDFVHDMNVLMNAVETGTELPEQRYGTITSEERRYFEGIEERLRNQEF